MYRVLMAVDADEDRALKQAQYVASLPEASETVEAILLFVFHDDGTEVPDDFAQFKSASRVASVRRAAKYLEEHSVETSILDDSGDATEDILENAEQYDVDAIVLGGRKRSPAGKAIFGSVTQSVILTTDRPVVVTGSASQ